MKTNHSNRGFTIVELLVVIVVIGILASITIVSYTGVTNKANKAAAQTTADSIVSKAQVFATEDVSNYYPTTYSALTTDSTKTYFLPATTATLMTTAMSAKPTNTNSVNIMVCGATNVAATAPTTAALTTKVMGLRVGYWDFSNTSASAPVYEDIGNVTTGVGAVTIGGTAYTTACNLAQS